MWHFSWNLHGLNWWKVGFTSHLARQRTCHRVVPVKFRRVSAPSVLGSARPRRYRHFVDELHLFFLHGFCGQFGLGEPASASVVALDMPMNCSSGISNLENFFLLAHVVDFSPGCSDSLSLHFHLDDLDLHCIFDSLVHLGLFLAR